MLSTAATERKTKPWSDDALSQAEGYPLPFQQMEEDEDMFSTADLPRTLLELKMNALSDTIRNKPDWRTKRLTLADKWKAEVQLVEADFPPYQALTDDLLDYVMQDLEMHAQQAERDGYEMGPFERIYRSDSVVPEALRQKLLDATRPLEDVPDEERDYHPNANNQVVDLVHPSLFPLRYGETIVTATGTTAEAPEYQNSVFRSARYQWLPSDFSVSASGQANLLSPYINNIHPRDHRGLSIVVSELLTASIPMFEAVLTSLKHPLGPCKTGPMEDVYDLGYSDKVMRPGCIWEGGEPPYPSEDSEEEANESDENLAVWLAKQPKVAPVAANYEFRESVEREPRLHGREIQVIVKLANIILTPNQPDYGGGTWHVEGMVNDSIVATWLYYYDEDNITESRLAFQTAVSPPSYHAQDDNECMMTLYGIGRDDPCVQDRGSVVTKQGRALAFPNMYRHQVQPFQLKDPNRPGYRKIVAFFLVNPDSKLPSASTIAMQQQEWIQDILVEPGVLGVKLPVELIQRIIKEIPGTMSLEEAKACRLDLMAERTLIRHQDNESTAFSFPFNLCEH